ncbi:MAG: hypothetical protein LUH04_07395, partial [Clostridium sp.]|nr:hypothetical protein [Clostridium sp.]
VLNIVADGGGKVNTGENAAGFVEKAVDRPEKCGYNKNDRRQKPAIERAEGPETCFVSRAALWRLPAESDQSCQKAGSEGTGAFWLFY